VVTYADGSRLIEEVGHHRGHARNPMTRADIDAKFDAATAGVLSPARRDDVRSAWWAMDQAADIAEPLARTADFTSS
jgi:2-methylcitrate dehydratase